MPFPAGSAVAVKGLHSHGHVLEVLPDGRYRVGIGGLTMVCTEAQLESVSQSKKQQRREREAPTRRVEPPPVAAAPIVDTTGLASIDLHGMTVPEALAALPGFLDQAIRAGLSEVRIIHGISGGKLRVAVREYLSKTPSVRAAASDERNRGVTIAYF